MLFLCFSFFAQAQSISIVRHGQAFNNVQDVHSTDIAGSKAFPLTEMGRSQVLKTAKSLKGKADAATFSRVLVSPLLRTQQTAQIIQETLRIPNSSHHETPLLSEAWVESFEGKKSLSPDFDEVAHFKRTGGESYTDLALRLFLFLSELCGDPEQGSVLLVTHETPARVLQYLLTSFAEDSRSVKDVELLSRWVFTDRLKKTMFDLKRGPKKFSNAELRTFNSELFCKQFKRKF